MSDERWPATAKKKKEKNQKTYRVIELIDRYVAIT